MSNVAVASVAVADDCGAGVNAFDSRVLCNRLLIRDYFTPKSLILPVSYHNSLQERKVGAVHPNTFKFLVGLV